MSTSQFRRHLQNVHSTYRALVEDNRLDELAQELGTDAWMPSTNGSSPGPAAIEVTDDIMAELRAAAAKRDRRAARHALDRLRRFIRLMESPTPESR